MLNPPFRWMVPALALLAPGVEATAAPPRKPTVRPRISPAAKPAPASIPAALKSIRELSLAPASALLEGPTATQRLVAMAMLANDSTFDATDNVTFTVSNPKLARVVKGVLQPLADGAVRVVARVNGVTSDPMDVTIRNSQAPVAADFVRDVEPVLAKAGCNMTACHGSPAGKGGFKLSLFGYEPELDHAAIARNDDGKRVNLKNPAESLLLKKSTMAVPHAGGPRFKVNSPEYRALVGWIKAGAPGLSEFEARVQKLEVIPDQPWMSAPKARQRLIVTAILTDGTAHDVTDKVLFSSNDDAIAAVDGDGMVTANRAGETAIMVRYLGQVGVTRIAVLPSWKLEKYPVVESRNFIDEHVQAKLKKLRVVPSDLCTDSEFIRRAYLDVCGIIPPSDEVRKFVADRAPNKREKLVDELLARPEFVDLWTTRWNDTLRNNPRLTRLGLSSYYTWIRKQVESNRPYDEWVRELITASGRNTEREVSVSDLPPNLQSRRGVEVLLRGINQTAPNPAANYFVISRDPLDVTAATSQIFLGTRLECARCHNHPFERWTQDDFYGMAAFFAGIQVRGQNQIPQVVAMNPRSGSVRHPKTNEVVEPQTLDRADIKMETGSDKRVALANWLASRDNPLFSKAIVNRIWGHYFGRGIVEPVDDMRVTNPAANPELLDALAKDLTTHNFDLKSTHRAILLSRTYQQSSKPNSYNREDTSNFARFYPKRMMAEQLFDSISQATGIFLSAPGGRNRRPALPGPLRGILDAMPANPQRVMQFPFVGGNNGRGGGDLGVFLDTFGKPRREAVCECERSADGNINQALTLINGNEVNQKISAPFGKVQMLIRRARNAQEVIEEMYLSALSRLPTPDELREADGLIRAAKTPGEGAEDLMWSLLNSREFLFNH